MNVELQRCDGLWRSPYRLLAHSSRARVHLIPSWFLGFSSPQELWLWRVSAIVITVEPISMGSWCYFWPVGQEPLPLHGMIGACIGNVLAASLNGKHSLCVDKPSSKNRSAVNSAYKISCQYTRSAISSSCIYSGVGFQTFNSVHGSFITNLEPRITSERRKRKRKEVQ